MRLTTNQDCLTRRQEGGGGMVLVLLRGSSLSRGVVPEQQLGRAPRGARHSFLAPHMSRHLEGVRSDFKSIFGSPRGQSSIKKILCELMIGFPYKAARS